MTRRIVQSSIRSNRTLDFPNLGLYYHLPLRFIRTRVLLSAGRVANRLRISRGVIVRKLTTVGFVLSALWLGAFGVILLNKWADAENMGLNEWGDFLAGLTAPLALMWVVIGYFLQGKELRINTEALKAQQEELRRQVEETAILAQSSDRQAAAAEQAVDLSRRDRARSEREDWIRRRIKLKLTQGINSAQGSSRIVLQNVGEHVSHLRIGEAISDLTLNGGTNLHPGDTIKLRWPASKPYPIFILLDYHDSAGRKRRSEFELTQKGDLVEQAETGSDDTPNFQ